MSALSLRIALIARAIDGLCRARDGAQINLQRLSELKLQSLAS